MAPSEEGLVKSGGAGLIGTHENIDLARNRFEAAYEREACAIANELTRAERQFDLVFDWVSSYHPSGHQVFSGDNVLAFRIVRPRSDFDKKTARG